MHTIQIKRIYAAAAPDDGCRVLVDRLWPRGIKKTAAGLDAWAKAIAPSTALRKSFAHEAARFDAFQTAYQKELNDNSEAPAFIQTCLAELQSRNVTLLYGAKDETRNNAAVLRDWLIAKMSNSGSSR